MKYLPALAALLSLAACALWIAALAGPWYHTSNPNGTEQHMGLYSSCESGEKHGHGHNAFEDAMGVTTFREELAQRQHHKHDSDDEEEDQYDREQHHKHKHKHKHKHEKEDMEKGESHEKEVSLPTLQPIIIQPTAPPQNINAPTTAAPLSPQPGDLQTGGGGGGGFGGWGGGGGGGFMRPTPGPTALPAHRVPPPGPTPFPASKHGHAYRDRGHHHHGDADEDEHEHEPFEPMSLNQVSAAHGAGSGSGSGGQDDTRPHEHKRPPADVEDEHAGGKHQHQKHDEKHGDQRGKKHGKKHQDKQEISGNNEFPYEETWVKALRLLLILAIIVSGIASLLQLLMAWNVGRALHKGSWTTSPTTAMIATALITLAGIHGLIVLFLFLSRRDELSHHGHFDYGYTLNIVATALALMSPILFWYTLDTSPTESLLGEETSSGGRRKYASVE